MENNEFFRKKIDQVQSIITNGQKPKIYEIDLKNLVSDPKKLKTYDTHISPDEAYIRLKREKDEYLIRAVAKSPKYALWYAKYVLKGPFPLGEPAIATSNGYSYQYAEDVLKGPFKLGEPAIAKDPVNAFVYARNVLKGPFKLGEPAIAKDAAASYHYARDILKGPFKLGEPTIVKDAMVAYWYAREVLKGPFPLGEPAIARDSNTAYNYVRDVLQGRPWTGLKKKKKKKTTEAIDLKKLVSDPTKLKTYDTHIGPKEAYDRLKKGDTDEYLVRAVAKDPQYALGYATDILKKPFPLGEPAIAKHPVYAYYYATDILKGPFPLGEPVTAKHGYWASTYAKNILKGPFPLGEPAIYKSMWADDYDTRVLKGRPWSGLKKKTTESIDLKKLVTDPTKLKTYDTHISAEEAYYRLKDGDKDPVLVKVVAKDPKYAYYYADEVLGGPFPLGEPAIAKDAYWAYPYARNVLKKPFPLGEPAIAKNAIDAYPYARYILKGPFPLGEPAIAKDGGFAYLYARNVLKDRPRTGLKKKKKTTESIDLKKLVSDPTKLKNLEKYISPEVAVKQIQSYAKKNNGIVTPKMLEILVRDAFMPISFINKAVKSMLEKYKTQGIEGIAKNLNYATLYVELTHAPCTILEPILSTTALSASNYAYVTKKPFPLGEPAIARSGTESLSYARHVIDKPFPLGEPAIAKSAELSAAYAVMVLGKPFPLGEPAIYNDAANRNIYKEKVLKGRRWTGLKKKKKVKESIDLKKLVSDPTKLKTYDTHIGPEEAYDRLLKGEKDEYLVRAVAKDPELAFEYAYVVLEGPFPLGEPAIATSAEWSYDYAKHVKGPWPPGEPAIAKDSGWAFAYARHVLDGRFPLGEPAIYRDPETSYNYKKFLRLLKETNEAIDLKNLVSDPAKLKTYDTHIGPKEAYDRLKKGEKDEYLVRAVAKDPQYALGYAYYVLNGRFPLGEPAIAKDPQEAYRYALNILKKPFPLGEPAIAKNATTSYGYAKNVLKGRFKLGEPAIYQDTEKMYSGVYRYFIRNAKKKTTEALDLKNLVTDPKKLKTYDTHISPSEAYSKLQVGDKDPILVKAVAKNSNYAFLYAKDILKGPFPLGEPIIAKDPVYAYYYASEALKGLFPLGEPAIATRAIYALWYAEDILKGPFKLGEPAIAKDPEYAYQYARYVLQGPFPMAEYTLAKNPYAAYLYARNVLKGPWPQGEPAIAKDEEWKQKYQEQVLKGSPWTGLKKKKKTTEALDLKNLVSDPTKLKTYDTHISPKEAYDRVLKGEKDEYLIRALAKYPAYAYWYAQTILKGPFPLGEPAIAKDSRYAYYYAMEVLKGPFKLGEPSIFKHIYHAFEYVTKILKKPVPEIENKIARSGTRSFYYAKEVLNGPFKKGERSIAGKPTLSYRYAREILGKSFPDGEYVISKSPSLSYKYALFVLKKPFPAGEPAIYRSPTYSKYYEKNVLKGRPWTHIRRGIY
jgi:hypothetical protein